jgi:hypothetical protein
MKMTKCIFYVISAMEALGLPLCVTHTAEHLRRHTEPCGSFAQAMHNVNNNRVESAFVPQ